tara:strand:- start:2557 stop:2661 length:105 start_codon:yes stop_codon:yes gene_type:complete
MLQQKKSVLQQKSPLSFASRFAQTPRQLYESADS